MPTHSLTYELSWMKARFLAVVAVLGLVIIFGSFILASRIEAFARYQVLAVRTLQYRLEYMERVSGGSMLAALPAALEAPPTTLAQRGEAAGVPVLTYHAIISGKEDTDTAHLSSFEGQNVSLAHFKDQMFALKEAGWQTVTLQDFEAFMRGEKALPEKSFLLTFDDGAKESFYPVDPVLAALGFNAVAFILPDHSLAGHSTYYLSKTELEHMVHSGRWEVGSHGFHIHQALPVVADGSLTENALSNRQWLADSNRLETHEEYVARIEEGLRMSKESLEDGLGVEVHSFAFPFGDYGQNRSNDPDAEETILDLAKRYYDFAFYQNWNSGDFLLNYPSQDSFLIKRIPVNPAWDGAQLLTVLSTRAPKPLPYTDTFEKNNGWQNEWGNFKISDNAMHLAAATSTTGAVAILDGSYTWSNYEVEMPVTWEAGYVILLFTMKDPYTGRACAYSADGTVQLQERTADDIFILRESRHPNVRAGAHTIGAITDGDVTTACLFDGERVIDATLPASSGGIGIATWDEVANTAEVFIKKTSVDKI